MTRVAFQGIAGAYSEEAIRQFFGPEVESVPCRTMDDLFPVVEDGDADYGMVPVENAVAVIEEMTRAMNYQFGD